MKSAYEVALGLVGALEKPTSKSQTMELTNQYYKQNNPNSWDQPFADKDVQFTKLFDIVELTQREKDIMYVSNFFHSSYTILHVKILTLGDEPTETDIYELKRTFSALTRLGCLDVLLNGKITEYEFLSLLSQ
jgi:hypothetical protein